MNSKYLNTKELMGVIKLGDAILPGYEEFPKFSQSGCIQNIDRVMAFVPDRDLKDLKMLLGIFGSMPRIFSKMIMGLIEFLFENNLPMGSIFRQIRLGMRGIVFSTYYCDPQILKTLQYETNVYLQDIK